jgi:hypothetical protein
LVTFVVTDWTHSCRKMGLQPGVFPSAANPVEKFGMPAYRGSPAP